MKFILCVSKNVHGADTNPKNFSKKIGIKTKNVSSSAKKKLIHQQESSNQHLFGALSWKKTKHSELPHLYTINSIKYF